MLENLYNAYMMFDGGSPSFDEFNKFLTDFKNWQLSYISQSPAVYVFVPTFNEDKEFKPLFAPCGDSELVQAPVPME
jgi:hypothetical protein